MILFNVLKIAKEKNKFNKALNYFAKDDFNIDNEVWNKIFVDQEKNTLKTDKPRQTLAIQIICKKISIVIQMTNSEQQFYNNFNINLLEI
jgi:hypothetical protein